jgi:hypothetical protein
LTVDESTSLVARKEKHNTISQMWVVKARNFLLENPVVPVVQTKAINIDVKGDINLKNSGRFDQNIGQTSNINKAVSSASKQSLYSMVVNTDSEVFEGRRAKIAKEKATLTTICKMLKSSITKEPKTVLSKNTDTTFGYLAEKRYNISTNRSISFGQGSYEITASYISKKFSKGLFGTGT